MNFQLNKLVQMKTNSRLPEKTYKSILYKYDNCLNDRLDYRHIQKQKVLLMANINNGKPVLLHTFVLMLKAYTNVLPT